jgi:predicted MFS family arabinose efflux permease
MLAVLRRPKIRIGLFATLLVVAGHFAGFTYIRPYLEGIPHLDVEMISLVLLAYGLGGFFGNIAGGVITSRSATLGTVFAAGGIAASAVILTLLGTSFGAFPVSIQSYITARPRTKRKAPAPCC